MSRHKEEKVELELFVHNSTADAWLVSEDGNDDNAVWIPKSQCERGEKKKGLVYEFELPEWLAFEKGFI